MKSNLGGSGWNRTTEEAFASPDLQSGSTNQQWSLPKNWWTGTELNRRDPVLQTGALPTELPVQISVIPPANHDAPPFDGDFPTYDWPKGMQAVDTAELVLPDDMPPGIYDIWTGLYEWPSLERVGITNEGEAVPDNAILLGEIEITEN